MNIKLSMGYRSNVAIGVSKEVLAHDLVTQFIPECIKNSVAKDTEESRIYYLEEWKFYDSYDEVKQILHWFKTMDELNLDYGAVRLGEEFGDVETWGDHQAFDISVHQQLEF